MDETCDQVQRDFERDSLAVDGTVLNGSEARIGGLVALLACQIRSTLCSHEIPQE